MMGVSATRLLQGRMGGKREIGGVIVIAFPLVTSFSGQFLRKKAMASGVLGRGLMERVGW